MKTWNAIWSCLACITALHANAQVLTHPTTGIQNTYVGACMVNTCGATITDDGGTAGDYSNNINNVYRTICPDVPGNCVRLTFTEFDLEPTGPLGCYDQLYIQNGPTQNSPVVWSGCGNTLPPVITANNPSGCLTVRFVSDGTNTAPGWEANVTCVQCANPNYASATQNNDCTNAQLVCGSIAAVANSQGPGLSDDVCLSGCAITENYSNWYTMNVSAGGTLGLSINPTPANVDYDFALFGPVTDCANLGTPLRCSYAATPGATGMNGSAVDATEDVSGNGWVSMPTVTPGTYYLLVNQWSYSSNAQFSLTFSGTANLLPAAPIASYNSPLCVDQTLQLSTDSVLGAVYSWTGPGGWSSNLQNPTRFPAVSGAYTVSYTLNGCASPAVAIDVIVNPAPNVSVNAPSICPGQSATLTAAGALNYTWSTGDSTNPITVSPVSTTNYSLTATDTNGCTVSAVSTVTVDSQSAVTVTPSSATVCAGSNTQLTADGAENYSWTPDIGLSATSGATVTANPTITTTYTVTGNSSNGCSDEATVIVTVSNDLVVDAAMLTARPRPMFPVAHNLTRLSGATVLR